MAPLTICDGLTVGLGELPFQVIIQYCKRILTVSDEEVVEALFLIWNRMKIICEPSCAVTLAVVLKYKDIFKGKNVGAVLTGGNVDM